MPLFNVNIFIFMARMMKMFVFLQLLQCRQNKRNQSIQSLQMHSEKKCLFLCKFIMKYQNFQIFKALLSLLYNQFDSSYQLYTFELYKNNKQNKYFLVICQFLIYYKNLLFFNYSQPFFIIYLFLIEIYIFVFYSQFQIIYKDFYVV
ncbi:transmembrane protein, putative (macronuclear) [Tetrahymena thermophila SB210]|uniref:Transmembrane protein, putative n=1 Tax=Tetrahymena thermophila (strain SB210) TaxID=312017 RepID=W7XA54_TETTS|nr:transmembrane protein, putative [Tetrahymena thermophila SB210]EWS76280.1 transmembrane protein, putative [Tetrahymena thermophila SB210]|eukprot:XP_012651064.1 transmembrane protein, putative [Tetrahymena thermophila SB210]